MRAGEDPGDIAQPLELELGCADLPAHDVRRELVNVSLDDRFPVANLLGHLAQLVSEHEEVANGVRRDDRPDSTVQRIREGSRISAPPRDLEGLPAQLVATHSRMLVAQGTCQAGEEPDPKLYVRLRKDSEPLFEQGHELLVTSSPSPDEAPPVARSGTGEVAWRTGAARDGGGVEEGLLRDGGVPGPNVRLAERQEEFTASALVARNSDCEDMERQLVEPGCLLVRQQGEGLVSRTLSVLDRPLRPRRRHGQREVVRELGQVRLDVAGVEGLEDFRDTRWSRARWVAGISSYNESRVRAWPKRSRPNEPGSSSTTRAVIASSSTLSSLSMPV